MTPHVYQLKGRTIDLTVQSLYFGKAKQTNKQARKRGNKEHNKWRKIHINNKNDELFR